MNFLSEKYKYKYLVVLLVLDEKVRELFRCIKFWVLLAFCATSVISLICDVTTEIGSGYLELQTLRLW